ncbi:MAG: hypothetical protein PHZ19_11855 [Candidatus Thermoplasmatota archaeon]|nr:hypothetical protein [Candidatus Thermoplasmatota archaeon]
MATKKRTDGAARPAPPPEPEFRAPAPEPEPEPLPVIEEEPGVPVGSLDTGQLVDFEGAIYRIDNKEDAVSLSLMEWDPTGSFRIARSTRKVSVETPVKAVT